jgi:hypothetical protein
LLLISLTPMANLLLVSKAPALLVAKFAFSVIDTGTGGKFEAGVVDTDGAH